MVIFIFVKLHLNWFQRLYSQNIVTIVKRWLFVIKGWKSHALEVFSVSFLSAHHNPHTSPLSRIDGFDYFWSFINKSNGACNMIENLHCALLLPGHRHIFHQLKYGVWNVFKSTKVNSFVLAESFGRHITMILNYFSK